MSITHSEKTPPTLTATVTVLRSAIADTFECLDTWCCMSGERLRHRPPYPGAWTVAEHLEHVSLVNHYLLLTITKGVGIALRRAHNQPVPGAESDLACLAPIADPHAFPWEPPGHMIPTSTTTVAEVRDLLADQCRECLQRLGQMGNGAGSLCAFRMSVYNLGRLDMYQWLYFLVQHARWHLAFLRERDGGGESGRDCGVECE